MEGTDRLDVIEEPFGQYRVMQRHRASRKLRLDLLLGRTVVEPNVENDHPIGVDFNVAGLGLDDFGLPSARICGQPVRPADLRRGFARFCQGQPDIVERVILILIARVGLPFGTVKLRIGLVAISVLLRRSLIPKWYSRVIRRSRSSTAFEVLIVSSGSFELSRANK